MIKIIQILLFAFILVTCILFPFTFNKLNKCSKIVECVTTSKTEIHTFNPVTQINDIKFVYKTGCDMEFISNDSNIKSIKIKTIEINGTK